MLLSPPWRDPYTNVNTGKRLTYQVSDIFVVISTCFGKKNLNLTVLQKYSLVGTAATRHR
jgi:hypothetical protein